MQDTETIIEFLIKKYGYKTTMKRGYIKPMYPKSLNTRIRKAIKHFLLFYDKDIIELKMKYSDYQKWIFEFIKKNGLEDKYKRECIKELII